jgi:hypothetical protein
MDKWNDWYKNLTKIGSFRYSDTVTYELGYHFLQNCNTVEDWGCGAGGFKRFFLNNNQKYIGIDGSNTPFSDIKTDLLTYTSNVDGIYMRHVLEHNYEWKTMLENACKSFNKQMCLILFTPFNETTIEIAHNLKHGVDVPDLSFDKNELLQIFEKYNITHNLLTINTSTGYGIEHVFYLHKNKVENYNLAFYCYFYGSNNNPAFMIPELPSLKYKCYYFTNNKLIFDKLKNTNWIGIYDDKPTTDDLIESCMIGKHVKTKPHEYSELKNYDYLCYLDSALKKVSETFVENFIQKYFIEQNYALLLRRHTFINSLDGEYAESIRYHHKYRLESEKYIKYINKQLQNGLSKTAQIPHSQCGFLIRNMKHAKMIEINNTWYQHIQECGIQDQISFFFVKQLFHEYILPFTEIPFV